MAADENGGGGADARLSVQHIVQRPFALGSGGCRSGAASLSGGRFGRCRAVTLAPPFNGAAAVKCFSAVFKFSVFFLRGFKQEQKYLRIAISIYIFLHWCCR